jgi:hypothetical protein
MSNEYENQDPGFEYTDNVVNWNSDTTLKQMYDHYVSTGTIDQHPDLKARYEFVYAGEAPDPSTYGYKREEDPNRTWDKEAKDGYEVEPGELRTLASKLETDLNNLELHLNKIKNHNKFTPEGSGGGTPGAKWSALANLSSTQFDEYFRAIQSGIDGVITNLRTTADNYESGHDRTQAAVDGNVDV